MDEEQKKELLEAMDEVKKVERAAEYARQDEERARKKLTDLANELRKTVPVGRITPRRAYSLGDGYIILFEYVPEETKIAVNTMSNLARENTRVTIIDGDGKEKSL